MRTSGLARYEQLVSIAAELLTVLVLDTSLHAGIRPSFIVTAFAAISQSISRTGITIFIFGVRISVSPLAIFAFFHQSLTDAVYIIILSSARFSCSSDC